MQQHASRMDTHTHVRTHAWMDGWMHATQTHMRRIEKIVIWQNTILTMEHKENTLRDEK